MNGTLNATVRRNILTDDHDVQPIIPVVQKPIIAPPVQQQPTIVHPPVQQQPTIVHPPIITQPTIVHPPIITQPTIVHPPVQQQPTIVHQPVKQQPTIVHPPIVTQLVDTNAPEIPELMRSINEIKDQYVKISMSIGQIGSVKNDLSTYKKITDARIEKIANLFLSINK